VLDVGGDLVERNEFVLLVVWLAVDPGLHSTLDVHGGGRRIDPPRGYEGECGERPEKHENEDEPSKKQSKRESAMGVGRTPPKRGPGVCAWHGGHL
jgi:hypothetical protein